MGFGNSKGKKDNDTDIKINNNISNESDRDSCKNSKKDYIYDIKRETNMMESKENKYFWIADGQTRGHFEYHPPNDDWTGFGLKVLGKYDQ